MTKELALRPPDEANQKLAATVRPLDWSNPTPQEEYDLVVIGAGTGGLVSAAIAAGLGARVALVEGRLMGGDCLNFGCVPSKAVLRAARAWAAARTATTRFGGPRASGEGDFSVVMERMRRIRAEISEADGAERFRSLGVDVFFGHARFNSPRSVIVGSGVLNFRRAIIATGSRAALPPIEGLNRARALTNETIFELTELPKRLVVIGAGPIGCELAQAFARFGSRVTLLEMAERILPREEPDAARIVLGALERGGVEVVGRATVTRVQREGAASVVVYEAPAGGCRAECDALLVAAGRIPNLDLDLEAAGVRHDGRGIRVDRRLRTSNRRVYAVGDVASPFQFTHAADAQARLAVRNALFYGRGKVDKLVIPWTTYTSPEVGRVGLSEESAVQLGILVDTITVPLEEIDRARLDGDDEGFFRIHLRRGSDQILGATIVAPNAGDLIAQVTQAMAWRVGLERLSDVIFPYPTVAEGLRKAADRRRREKLTPRIERAFRLFFSVARRLT